MLKFRIIKLPIKCSNNDFFSFSYGYRNFKIVSFGINHCSGGT